MNEDELKELAWESAQVIVGINPKSCRKDACGAWIHYDEFNNTDSLYGWEIDHIIPIFILKQNKVPTELWNHPKNIRALHWENNRSKGNSYPIYKVSISSDNNLNSHVNSQFLLSEVLQYELSKIFGQIAWENYYY